MQIGEEKNVLSFFELIEQLKDEKEKPQPPINKPYEDIEGPLAHPKQDLKDYESIEKRHKISEIDWKASQNKNRIRIRSIFKLVYDYLGKSLFNPIWEIRHGACVALRNFIKKDIHKLYISLEVDPEKIASETNQEEALTTFIRESIKTLKFSNDFFEDFLARQLVVIALDRFMDHSSDRVSL